MKPNPSTFGNAVRKLNPNLYGTLKHNIGVAVERERDLHEDIRQECERRGWMPLTGSMAARTHRTEGESDFIVVTHRGVLFVECKSAGGKLSQPQISFKARLEKLGHVYYVVRSLEEFLEILKT